VLCDVYENLGEGAAWTELAQRIENLLPQATRSGRHAALCALAMWRTSHGDDIKGRQAAQEALSISSSPVEIRRSAQRLAFSCLPSLSLDQAAEAAEQALEASGSHPQLRARSLRTLGVVRMWQGEGNEAVRLHEETLALARWKGLSSRAALALQDLGDSLRVSGRSEAARERYQSSILAAEALDLASTVFLVRFKLLMCDIALEEETDLSSQLSALTGPATDAGLALAEPFGSLLLAWSSARNNHLESARTALEKAKVLEGFRVDPQVEEIFREIREKIN
jgi:tetratricopeptide (TPR) repeat protein